MKKVFTRYYDDNKKPIYVGDTLKSEYGYHVIVYKEGRNYLGKLICEDDNSCKNIPYSLNKGKGHVKISNRSLNSIMKKIDTINKVINTIITQEETMTTEELSITPTQEKEINKWKSKLPKTEQSKNECINFMYLHGKVSSIYATIGKNILDLTEIK